MKVTHLKQLNLAACVILTTTILIPAELARGQAGPGLLLKPWDADQMVEDQSKIMFFSGGHVQGTDAGFDLTSFESEGRVRVLPGNEASPRLGYDLTYLNTNTGEKGFPGQLLDASVAAGTFISNYNGWVTGLTLGLGYAGDSPFGDGRAWYGRADFVVAKKFSDIDALGIGIDYDGHRTYAPDIPLPGFGWSHQLYPTLEMVIGAPLTSITWRPTDRIRIYADYLLVTDFDLEGSYEFVKHWTAFAGMATRDLAFYASELPEHRRLLYTQRRVEAGIRWIPRKFVTVSLSGGYGFDTRFQTGWDYRNTNTLLHSSPEPFVALAVDLRF